MRLIVELELNVALLAINQLMFMPSDLCPVNEQNSSQYCKY